MRVTRVMMYLLCLCLSLPVLCQGFSCVCSPTECEGLTDSDCPEGSSTVWDPCGCCKVCSRTEGEPCGGPYGFYGSCAAGLECVVTDMMSDNNEGVCNRVPGTDIRCVSPVNISGCNIVGGHCHCDRVPSCPEDRPFVFQSLTECQMNLAVMLAHLESMDKEEKEPASSTRRRNATRKCINCT